MKFEPIGTMAGVEVWGAVYAGHSWIIGSLEGVYSASYSKLRTGRTTTVGSNFDNYDAAEAALKKVAAGMMQ